MGTLGNQPARSSNSIYLGELDAFLEDVKKLAKKHSITIESVIECKRVLEMERKNNINVQSGDYLDEQAGGFGDILSRIASALKKNHNKKLEIGCAASSQLSR